MSVPRFACLSEAILHLNAYGAANKAEPWQTIPHRCLPENSADSLGDNYRERRSLEWEVGQDEERGEGPRKGGTVSFPRRGVSGGAHGVSLPMNMRLERAVSPFASETPPSTVTLLRPLRATALSCGSRLIPARAAGRQGSTWSRRHRGPDEASPAGAR